VPGRARRVLPGPRSRGSSQPHRPACAAASCGQSSLALALGVWLEPARRGHGRGSGSGTPGEGVKASGIKQKPGWLAAEGTPATSLGFRDAATGRVSFCISFQALLRFCPDQTRQPIRGLRAINAARSGHRRARANWNHCEVGARANDGSWRRKKADSRLVGSGAGEPGT
jgi:hypothetical protein